MLPRRIVSGRSGGAVWTPADLFASGAIGGWYDPNDLSTLFQDAAGTVPVTTVGQYVRLMKDKSGNNYHITAPSDADRPQLAQASSGRYYLVVTTEYAPMVGASISLSGYPDLVCGYVAKDTGLGGAIALYHYPAATSRTSIAFSAGSSSGYRVPYTDIGLSGIFSSDPDVYWKDRVGWFLHAANRTTGDVLIRTATNRDTANVGAKSSGSAAINVFKALLGARCYMLFFVSSPIDPTTEDAIVSYLAGITSEAE